MDEQINKAICPACRSDDCAYLYAKDGWSIYECNVCDLSFVFPMPISTRDIYSKEYFTGGDGDHGYTDYEDEKKATARTLELFLDRIRIHTPMEGKKRLLDVGAATGFFVELASKKGFEAEGIEISDYAVIEGRRRGRRMTSGTLEQAPFDKGSFDIVTMLDFFEHLTDPRSVLSAVSNILKQDGLLVLNIPDKGSVLARILGRYWHLFIPPEHLLYFTESSLVRLALGFGFEKLESRRYVKTFPLAYVLITLSRYLKWPMVARLARSVERTWLRKIKFPIPTLDNLFIILRKHEGGIS